MNDFIIDVKKGNNTNRENTLNEFDSTYSINQVTIGIL